MTSSTRVLILALFPLPMMAQTIRQVGPGQTYSTISACISAMSAGDTCNVHAGTYTESPTISAGTAGNYKTVQANGTDVVTVVGGFTVNSHTKVIGLQIQNPSSPTSAPCVNVTGGITDYFVTNNTMYACNQAVLEQTGSNTTFGYIQGNTISYMCTTTGVAGVCRTMTINGDNHLIENNIISHVSDGPYVFGKHNVLRGNTFGPTTDADCSVASGDNCHIDFMQADANGATQPAQFLLMEGNTVQNMAVTGVFAGAGAHAGPLLQAEACSGNCFNAILRFHTALHIAGGGSTNDNSGTTPVAPNSPAWINFKAYNNTWADVLNGNSANGAEVNGHSHGSTGASNVNEIYYLPHNGAGNGTNPYDCQDTSCTGYTYGNSDAFCAGSSPCVLYGHTYSSGAFTADPGNISVDPLFVNYAGGNLNLSTGSPALNTGTFLTTVANTDTGSGTSLIVNDAGFFQAGSSLAGVSSDCISVTTVSIHVCATAINYSTNTITLASGVTRSHGDPVWLYSDSKGTVRLTGSAPNMGAFGTSTPAVVLTGSQLLIN